MAKVLLTGCKGQVGTEIEFALLKAGHQVVACSHKNLDIAQADYVLSAVIDSKAEVVINAAAYTNVEKSEDETSLAYSANAIGARNIAKACVAAKIPLIHISSDYVLADNKRNAEYEHSETDETDPQSVYGKSKLDGENNILSSGCKAIIVRTSWVFGRFGRNFVKIMLSLGQDRHEIAVVCDQIGNPTPARALAEAIVKIVERVLEPDFEAYGIYNYCGQDATTWDEFARAIFELAQQMNVLPHEVKVVSISSNDFKSKAQRPRNSRLATDKIKENFDLEMPYWPDYLGEVISAYVRESQGLRPVEEYDSSLSAQLPSPEEVAALEAALAEQPDAAVDTDTDTSSAISIETETPS